MSSRIPTVKLSAFRRKRFILRAMLLQYRTAVATQIQFIVVTLFSLLNGADSVVSTCSARANHCVGNMLPTTLLFLLTAFTFGAIWVLGFAVQDRRSHRLAYLLIMVEGAVFLIASFNLSTHHNFISLLASLADGLLAIWVASLAFRLSRAKGGRIVASERVRRRPAHNPKIEL